jgi:hypothetical protein
MRGRVAGDGLVARIAGWNGEEYERIALTGYIHQRNQPNSNVAFFPAYPLATRAVARLVNVRLRGPLLIVPQICLVGCFVAMAVYLRKRIPESQSTQIYALACLGAIPTSCFFRVAYSEAMLVFLLAIVLVAIECKWRFFVIAFFAGLASGTRPVGVAVILPCTLLLWRRARQLTSYSRPTQAMITLSGAVVACWGLLGFVVFQWIAFGDPLAMVRSQAGWLLRHGEEPVLMRELLGIATLEPIWSTYVPSKIEYWARYEPHQNPLLSLQFANPIYFLATIGLVIIGWRTKWLNDYEVLLSAGLLLIPYVTKSYDNAMASFGRFSVVVLPAYIVMGHLLARMPRWLAAALLAISAFFLAVYSAMFAAGYRFI